MSRILALCLSLCFGTLAAEAQNWPSFRGSNASGVADGKLYLASEDGEVFVVKVGPKFELLATNPMGEPLMSTPAISDGIIILRSQNYVSAISERAALSRPKNTD